MHGNLDKTRRLLDPRGDKILSSTITSSELSGTEDSIRSLVCLILHRSKMQNDVRFASGNPASSLVMITLPFFLQK